MDTYRTEEEQIEDLRRWWKENGKAILLGIVLAVVIVFGWQGWQKNERKSAAEASELYTQYVSAILAASVNPEQLSTAEHLHGELQEKHKSTAYRQYADLLKVGYFVQKNELSDAATLLEDLLARSKDDEIQAIARIRLGRVKSSLGQYDEALKVLDSSFNTAWSIAQAEAKGDVYLAQGKNTEAGKAYQQAMTLSKTQELRISPILLMKAGATGVKPNSETEK